MKNSKVKSIQPAGNWVSKQGNKFYKFDIEMSNGDKGEYSSKLKDQTYFKVGESKEYEYISGPNPKIKPIYTPPANAKQSTNNDGRDLVIARQSSLKVACEICLQSGELENLLPMADKLTKWVLTGEK